MNIWNTVFLVLVFILSGLVAFFTAQEMKIRQEWNRGISSLESKLADAEKRIDEAVNGIKSDKPEAERSIDEMRLSALEMKLRNLIFERGKAWFECTPGQVSADGQILLPQQLGGDNPQTDEGRLKPIKLVEVKLTITGPVEANNGKEEVIAPSDLKGVVYLFDEGKDFVGAKFLGRFTVGTVQRAQAGYMATLFSANELNQEEVQLIETSRGSSTTWAVYTAMPIDRYAGIFDIIPEETLDEIIAATDPKDGSKWSDEVKNPKRELMDFDFMLTRLYLTRVFLNQEIDSTKRYTKMLASSNEIARNEEANLKSDSDLEEKRNRTMNNQVETLQRTVDQYDKIIAELKGQIEATQTENEKHVAQIAQIQLQAAERIEKKAAEAAAATE